MPHCLGWCRRSFSLNKNIFLWSSWKDIWCFNVSYFSLTRKQVILQQIRVSSSIPPPPYTSRDYYLINALDPERMRLAKGSEGNRVCVNIFCRKAPISLLTNINFQFPLKFDFNWTRPIFFQRTTLIGVGFIKCNKVWLEKKKKV